MALVKAPAAVHTAATPATSAAPPVAASGAHTGGPGKPAIAAVVLVALALLLPVALPWIKTPIIIAACFGIAALGVSLLIRAGQMSFGHAMFSCAAGYAVAFTARSYPHLDSSLLILLGAVFGALTGAVIGLFVVRYRGIFFGMLNLALSMVLFAVLGKFFNLTGGTDGMRLERSSFLGMALERDGFETALLVTVVVLAVLLGWMVKRYLASVSGQQLSAIKTNETRMEFLGVSAYRVLLTGYVLSAALCGLSGAIFAITQGLVTPEMGYWVRSGEIVFIAILGGIGHPVGAFIGAAIFEFVKVFAAAYLTGAWQMVLGLVLIAMVFFAPLGISGLLAKRKGEKS
jgi:ABC-type branched-subunit amino acid transport system permease subunit